MDESVINGANLFFAPQFGIDPATSGSNQWKLGLVNSAPYVGFHILCFSPLMHIPSPVVLRFHRVLALPSPERCARAPRDHFHSRRSLLPHLCLAGCYQLVATSIPRTIRAGVGNRTEEQHGARICGRMRTSCHPRCARDDVVSPLDYFCRDLWNSQALLYLLRLTRQTWTAFGIMLGFVSDLAFFRVPNRPHITGLNWRLMLSSVSSASLSSITPPLMHIKAGVPALLLIAQVYFCPESPRWYISKGRYVEAYKSLSRLRHKPIQAARDLYCSFMICI
jgi:hypothetical protein